MRIALVGASMRIRAFVEALKSDYADSHQICGLMDIDEGKMLGFNEVVGLELPCYTDFDHMCDKVKPDLLLISTVDCFHRDYIVRALDRKISCIAEKPLCVNAEQCCDIIATQQRNPEVFAATSHNARYHVAARAVKKLLDDGVIGQVNSVNYTEMLDREHGTSYFRRWNSIKAISGGLAIHKASHHFDKINWWLNSKAKTVSAYGGLRCFGAEASPFRGHHCSTCPYFDQCAYAIDYEKEEIYHKLFFKHNHAGAYRPDRCVFSPEIDIEDFISAGIEYGNGVLVNYTLSAHCNYEGETIIFEGNKGRLEMIRRKRPEGEFSSVEIFRFGTTKPEKIDLKLESGTHGGADKRLYRDLFGGEKSGRLATLDDGIQAVLVGVAVNESIKTGQSIDVASLI